MQSQPSEVPLYNDGQVVVTTARFVVGSTLYPIRGITAVQPVVIPANRSGGIITALVGLCILMIAVMKEDGGFGLIGVIVTGVGVAVAVAAKATYIVRAWIAGGQVDAVASPDWARIQQIVAALHRATMGV